MKTRLFILTVLLSFVFALCSNAQNIKDFDGSYYGQAQVAVKGKVKPAQNMTFILKQGVLSGVVPKIGKMPGKIIFKITNVSIDKAGNLTAKSKYGGEIKMFGFMSSALHWNNNANDKQGTFHGTMKKVNGSNHLSMKIHVYASMMGMSKVAADVTFNGQSTQK